MNEVSVCVDGIRFRQGATDQRHDGRHLLFRLVRVKIDLRIDRIVQEQLIQFGDQILIVVDLDCRWIFIWLFVGMIARRTTRWWVRKMIQTIDSRRRRRHWFHCLFVVGKIFEETEKKNSRRFEKKRSNQSRCELSINWLSWSDIPPWRTASNLYRHL